MSRTEKLLLILNSALYTFLAVFSYSYVDLNLTISQNPAILYFVKQMQELGYYQRPIATITFLLFLVISFSIFVLNLLLFKRSKIGVKYLTVSTTINTLILIFAYPFLSSDLFNYLFDAKIILKYHLSPYTHKPLDFPQDEWLRFMRWIHRYSPYGPLWLLMSLIPAGLGLGKFILNFFAFKIFIAAFHLANTYLIFKILKKVNPKFSALGAAFYGLNPLFLIEGVVNAHNDVILATSFLASIYFISTGRKISSYLAILAGILIKYIPVLNLPWLILYSFRSKSFPFKNLIILNLITMAVFTLLFSSFRISVPFVSTGSTQVQFQPWYLFWTIPYLALIPNSYFLIPSVLFGFGAMLRYLPYLYWGDWSQQGAAAFMQGAILIAIFLALLVVVIQKKFSNKLD